MCVWMEKYFVDLTVDKYMQREQENVIIIIIIMVATVVTTTDDNGLWKKRTLYNLGNIVIKMDSQIVTDQIKKINNNNNGRNKMLWFQWLYKSSSSFNCNRKIKRGLKECWIVRFDYRHRHHHQHFMFDQIRSGWLEWWERMNE